MVVPVYVPVVPSSAKAVPATSVQAVVIALIVLVITDGVLTAICVAIVQ